MTMQRLLVDTKNITETRLERVAEEPLKDGEARLKIESFALTANNVTYAAAGFAIGYWQFFPTGVDGQGLVPVWGVAEVVESKSDHLAKGARLYGFYPLAETLAIRPEPDGHGGIVDAAPHRADLPAVYNRYAPVQQSSPEKDHMRALLQPLLATSYLLFDWLMDNNWFGAQQIIIGSASSKTGLGLCKFLAEPAARDYKIIGLTSPRNVDFVSGLGACDQVLSYKQIEEVANIPSVYVDMAGNADVKTALHEHLNVNMLHSVAVGTSHWDKFRPHLELPGAKPQFFFAPSQIAKRREDWGPGVIDQKITEAWKRIASDASKWMDVQVHHGLDAAESVYAAIASGAANPRDGHIIRL